jgi:hypothetical protein
MNDNGNQHHVGKPGVIKGLVVNGGLVVAASGHLVENRDIASGTITLDKLHGLQPGTLLAVGSGGVLQELKLGTGLQIVGGVLSVAPQKARRRIHQPTHSEY